MFSVFTPMHVRRYVSSPYFANLRFRFRNRCGLMWFIKIVYFKLINELLRAYGLKLSLWAFTAHQGCVGFVLTTKKKARNTRRGLGFWVMSWWFYKLS